MTWRREDYGYAAAALAAVAFLAYVVAGNFGLVPSPLGRGHAEALPQAEVAGLVISNPATARPLPIVDVAPPTSAPTSPTTAPSASRTPLAAPSVYIDTPSGTKVGVMSNQTVVGRVAAPAGLTQVRVQYSSMSSGVTTAVATTHCASATNCTWSAPVPQTAGSFKVIALGTDKTGRTALSNTITITVVNPPNVLGGVPGVGSSGGGSPVSGAASTLGEAVNSLLGALHP